MFWDENKDEVQFGDVSIDLAEILRNGGAKDKAQLLIKLDDLVLAGFGVFNPKTGRLKRAHGFFAGKLPAGQCRVEKENCEFDDVPAQVFKPCALDTAVDSEGSIAYGRWNLAWKSEKVALIKAGNTALSKGVLLPSGFTPVAE